MKNYLLLILGMMAVTYLPRLVPLLIMTERPPYPVLRQFLLYIPYAALSALIMSGVMHSASEMRLATVVGVIVAGVCTWFKGGLVLSVVLSVITAFVFSILK